jgi:hypothetical protein
MTKPKPKSDAVTAVTADPIAKRATEIAATFPPLTETQREIVRRIVDTAPEPSQEQLHKIAALRDYR